jgi:hypothetical protein
VNISCLRKSPEVSPWGSVSNQLTRRCKGGDCAGGGGGDKGTVNQTHSLRSKHVGKANKNKALLWKIVVLGMKKPPVGVENFFPSPMLVLYIPSCRKCLPALRMA